MGIGRWLVWFGHCPADEGDSPVNTVVPEQSSRLTDLSCRRGVSPPLCWLLRSPPEGLLVGEAGPTPSPACGLPRTRCAICTSMRHAGRRFPAKCQHPDVLRRPLSSAHHPGPHLSLSGHRSARACAVGRRSDASWPFRSRLKSCNQQPWLVRRSPPPHGRPSVLSLSSSGPRPVPHPGSR